MNGITREDRIKRSMRLNPVYPRRGAVVEILERELAGILVELLTCLFQHRFREIHEYGVRRWVLTQNGRAQDSVTATQIEKIFDRLFPRFEYRHHHADLLLCQRDRRTIGQIAIDNGG